MLLKSEAMVCSARPVRSAKGLSKTQFVKSETAWLISKEVELATEKIKERRADEMPARSSSSLQHGICLPSAASHNLRRLAELAVAWPFDRGCTSSVICNSVSVLTRGPLET